MKRQLLIQREGWKRYFGTQSRRIALNTTSAIFCIMLPGEFFLKTFPKWQIMYDKCNKYNNSGQYSQYIHAKCYGQCHGCCTPYSSSCSEPRYPAILLKNDTSSQEADTRHYRRGDPGIYNRSYMLGNEPEGARSECYSSISSDTGFLSMKFALDTDGRSQ